MSLKTCHFQNATIIAISERYAEVYIAPFSTFSINREYIGAICKNSRGLFAISWNAEYLEEDPRYNITSLEEAVNKLIDKAKVLDREEKHATV